MRRIALALAIAAVAVAAPRLVLIFLEADSLQVEIGLRKVLLGASGAALALVLTGGGAYLVHAIVRIRRFQGLLLAIWVGILTCIAILVTPRLVAGLRLATSPLADVLSTDALRWGWSIVAVLAGELVATGCMLAYAAQHQQQQEHHQLLAELERLGRERNRLQQRLRQLEQRQLAPATSEPAAADPQPAAAAATSPLAAAAGEQLAAAASSQPAAAEEQPAAAATSRPAAAAAEQLAAAAASSGSASKPGGNGTPPDEPPIPCRYGCGYVARNFQAERGHLAACPKHPKYLRRSPSESSQSPSESSTESQDDGSGA